VRPVDERPRIASSSGPLWCRILLFLLVLILLLHWTSSLAETLDVATCTPDGGTSCSVSGLNSDDTLGDGATIAKGKSVSTTWTDTTFASGSTITNVTLILTHGGEAGINGNVQLTFRNGAQTTTYCTFSWTNTASTLKETTETMANCSWTKARLDDLDILISHTGTANKKLLVSFIDLNITYLPPDTQAPNVTLSSPGNDTWDLDGDVTFSYIPTDNRGLQNCSLYLNGAYNQTNSTPLVNGSVNSFALIGMADGNWNWKVNCSDTNGLTNVSLTRLIKVDTKGPDINLVSPPDFNSTTKSAVTFWYNATDAQTTLATCILVVNDTVENTDNAPPSGVNRNFTADLTNGNWTWWVNCTDSNGFTNMSLQRHVFVNTSLPLIAPTSSTYPLGQTAAIDGINFNPGTQVAINYTFPNGSLAGSNLTTTDGAGAFMDSLLLNYLWATGTYTVYAYQTGDPTTNASTSFSAALPPTAIVTQGSVMRGDESIVNGSDFRPGSGVNITYRFSDGSNTSMLVAVNVTGGFRNGYNLSYAAPLGETNITAIDTVDSRYNASTSFTILNRTAAVTTDLGLYGRDDPVSIYGVNFTRLGTVQLAIYDNSTNDTGSGFPLNKTADDTGYFTHVWNTNSWCNGVYRVEAVDQNNSVLNDTAYFEINEEVPNTDIKTATSGAKYATSLQPITLSNILDSNDVRETLTANGGSTWYFEVNFTNAYNPSLTTQSVIFLIEHEETSGLQSPALQWWNGSTYVGVSCPGFSVGSTDHNDTCDLSSLFSDVTKLNAVSLRFTIFERPGGTETLGVDYVHLNITTSYQPSCTYFNGSTGGGLSNNPPFIQSVLLEDNVASPADELDLTPGLTKDIRCNLTVTDGDGFSAILGANATLYSTTVTADSPDDDRTHYTNSSCTFVAGLGNEANFTCAFPVWYYALNGTWTCQATAWDGSDTTTQSDSSWMNPLYALNISTTLIDYGNVSEGMTSAEQQTNVTNIGNAVINLSLLGYGSAFGDELSFACAQENLSITDERYGLSAGTYASKTPLASSFAPTGLVIQPTTTGIPSLNSTYWQVQVPGSATAEPRGQCNGIVVFQAEVP